MLVTRHPQTRLGNSRRTLLELFPAPIAIFFSGVLSILILFWTQQINEGERMKSLIQGALMDAQIRASNFHLHLEDFIAGEPAAHIEKAWEEFDQAYRLLGATLVGGVSEHDPILRPLQSPTKRGQAHELTALLEALEALAQLRLDRPPTIAMASVVEDEFKLVFSRFLTKAKELEWAVEQDRLEDQNRSRRVFWVLLFVWTCIVIAATLFLWRVEYRRRSYERELQSANQQLISQAEELAAHKAQLMEIVEQRTAEIERINFELRQEVIERRRSEQQAEKSREALRKLAAYLESVRERERARLAREIHDELGLNLTMMSMDVAWLEENLSENGCSGDGASLERIRSISSSIADTIALVREIATRLRPGILDDIGLIAAIEWQSYEFQKKTGILCRPDELPEQVRITEDKATVVFRIYQEILANVARHAGATEVRVDMRLEDGRLCLEVKDNGRGISQEQISDPNSLGILGMRERAITAGGGLRIDGNPGLGTLVAVEIPLEG